MSRYVVAQEDGEDYLILGAEGALFVFETKQDAEDFVDALDEPGEFVVIDYDPVMGENIMLVV